MQMHGLYENIKSEAVNTVVDNTMCKCGCDCETCKCVDCDCQKNHLVKSDVVEVRDIPDRLKRDKP